MDEDGTGYRLDQLERFDQFTNVVTVDWTDVRETELLPNHGSIDHFFETIQEAVGEFDEALTLWEMTEEALDFGLRLPVACIGADAIQVAGQCSDVRRDRHLVVVQNDDERNLQASGVVEGLVSHSAGQGAIANDGDRMVVLAPELGRDRHAECGRDRGRSMTGTELVVRALLTLQKAAESPFLANRVEAIAPSGHQFMWVSLMPNVPDDLVVRRIEDVVQC